MIPTNDISSVYYKGRTDSSNTNDTQMKTPEHLITLPGSDWKLWRTMALRGAGFPAKKILDLASPEMMTIANQAINLRDQLAQTKEEAIHTLSNAIAAENPSSQMQRELSNILQSIHKDRIPRLLKPESPAAKEIAHFHDANIQAKASWQDYLTIWQREVQRIAEVIIEVAHDARFREAILWQNRLAYHTGVEALLRRQTGPIVRNSQYRQHEALIANYLQRYSVKNDTIGFFGPVGWANFAEIGPAIDMKPGADLLAKRTVYFEAWCIQAVARSLSKISSLLPWIPPFRHPFVALRQNMLYIPSRPPVQLTQPQMALLQLCNGESAARGIAKSLVQQRSDVFSDQQQVYQMLAELQRIGAISWIVNIPTEPRTEITLKAMLEKVGDEHARHEAYQMIEQLETLKDAVATAAGNTDELEHALTRMESTFSQLTHVSATRAEGKTYAARTLVYEDCRRDLSLSFGPELLEKLGPPLNLMLTSARWFTYQIAREYRRAFSQLYATITRETNSRTIDLQTFWNRSYPLLFGNGPRPIDTVLSAFQNNWAKILSLPTGVSSVSYQSQGLQSQVASLFNAPRPGWKAARHHSPDIMISATSADEIIRGNYQLVMGEFHMASNTLAAALFIEQHPDPSKILDYVASDIPEPRLLVITPTDWPELTARTSYALGTPKDYYVVFATDTHVRKGAKAHNIPIGDIIIENTGTGIWARTRQGNLQFDLIEVFAEALSSVAINQFKIFQPNRHTPRVTIDGLIINRETWTYPTDQLAFAFEDSEERRFAYTCHWGQLQQLPRFVFVKSPIERKPFYVDFASPIYTEILAKVIRRTAESKAPGSISFSEMLPNPQNLWLTDAEGQQYTCELRCIAVDSRN
jgi:Lantibiotic dehydratase, N terminus